jgi:tRNA A-37 threonylcarbamoyl transferase component Bud32
VGVVPDNNAPVFERLSDGRAVSHAWSGLTPDLLERIRARVKALAWLLLVVNGLGIAIDSVYFFFAAGSLDAIWIAGTAAGAALSVSLVLIATNRRLSHATVLYAALAFEVLICLDLAVLMPWFMWIDSGHLPVLTWVEPLIVLFPLIVPAPPRMTAITLALAAATRPLALAFLHLVVGVDADAAAYYMAVAAPAFAAAMAYAGARIVYGMTVEVAEARRMGSYRLTERLGSGGMGEVWRAEHRLLARPAAVKLVRAERLARDPEQRRVALARFEREAQATALLRSPHTIELYDFGVKDDGTLYYVMELLSGLDLDAMIHRFGPLRPVRAIQFALQVCDSLGEAHERGLIHRDIKPGNLFVCRYGRRADFVKVLDLGLVKQHGDGVLDEDAKLTADDTVSGTPAFLAPEQVVGAEIDGRTDIYALGCVLYWMLTGAFVFEGRSAMDTMLRHVQNTPTPPSARAEQPIPAALDELTLACLAKSPADRPHDIDVLAEWLGSIDAGEPWTAERATEWWGRHLPEL